MVEDVAADVLFVVDTVFVAVTVVGRGGEAELFVEVDDAVAVTVGGQAGFVLARFDVGRRHMIFGDIPAVVPDPAAAVRPRIDAVGELVAEQEPVEFIVARHDNAVGVVVFDE